MTSRRPPLRPPHLRFKAIAFDLWETLITDTPETAGRQERRRIEQMQRILAEAGTFLSGAQVEEAYLQLWHRCHELYWSRDRDIEPHQQIVHFLEELQLSLSSFTPGTLEALEHAYVNAALEHVPTVIPGSRETLKTLEASGLAIGLISNTGRTPGSVLRKVLEVHGLSESIDVMVFSNEHGECKPRPSIFESLRQSLALRFEEIVFVGDNPYVDVHGAQSCGMFAVHLDRADRGMAVAAPVDHGLDIVPDATITELSQLVPLLWELNR